MVTNSDYIHYTDLCGPSNEASECLIATTETLKFNQWTRPSYLTLGYMVCRLWSAAAYYDSDSVANLLHIAFLDNIPTRQNRVVENMIIRLVEK